MAGLENVLFAGDSTGMEDFYRQMAPHLAANLLAIVFIACFLMISKDEKYGKGSSLHLYVIPLFVLIVMLYGLYLWGGFDAFS